MKRAGKVWRLAIGAGLCGMAFGLGAVTQRYYGLGNLIKLFYPEYKKPWCAVPSEYRGKLRVFILAGQSNMEGGGYLRDYTPLETHGRAFVFTKDYKWFAAKEPLSGSGVGPALAFACRLLERDPGIAVGLVPCARGGTNIGQWQRAFGDHTLYGKCLMRAKAASVMGGLAGVLFSQGENDAEGDPNDHPHDWKVMFERFAQDLRRDIGKPDLPIIFAQLGPGQGALWQAVQKQQASVRLPGCVMIHTDDLKFNPGHCHFDTASQMQIGRRFADAYMALEKQRRQER